MSTWKWLAALGLLLGLSAPSFAQVNNASFGGISPTMLQSQAVNTGASVAPVPIAQPQFLNHTFSLANFLPNISMFNANPVIGMSQFPSADGMPGKAYLQAFGWRRPPSFRPD